MTPADPPREHVWVSWQSTNRLPRGTEVCQVCKVLKLLNGENAPCIGRNPFDDLPRPE